MKKIFETIGLWIIVIIDFIYPPFKKYFTPQFFRYGVTGVANMAFDLLLYMITFHYILDKQMLHLGLITFSSHIAALIIVFPISFTTGFLLQKYVTFTASEIKGRIQLYRYLSVVIANLLLNYLGLKLLVDFLNFFPTPSKMIITIFTTLFSYFSQKSYTFKSPQKS